MTELDRYIGSLLGLAVGDALGTTLEFKAPGTFTPITDIVGGGPFELEPGQWTDDTSMALCLAESLVECRAFDAVDQMRRYLRYWREGYWSSRPGVCFDIGVTVRGSLERFEATGDPYAGPTDERSAGNGSLMRLAPVPLFFAADAAAAVNAAAASSRTTHGAAEAVDACRYFAALIVGAVRGESKTTLLSKEFFPNGVDWERQPLSPSIQRIAAGSFKGRDQRSIRASGYVVHTLEAALWAFNESSSFKEGALLAVNLGEDADTTGAVYGQLAGAYYGVTGIPQRWREVVHERAAIVTLARRIWQAGNAQ